MRTYGGAEVEFQALTLGLDGCERSASCTGLFNPEKRAPVPNGWEDWWAPVPVWTRWRKRKKSLLLRE
jgi:hypothetical protein